MAGAVLVVNRRASAAETMAYSVSGLNLFFNAIILWNTVYLSRVVDYVRAWGVVIPDDLLAQVASLPLAHIALTSDYLGRNRPTPRSRAPTSR